MLHLHPFPGEGDPVGSMTSGEQRESVATAVMFRSGEDECVKRATLASKSGGSYLYTYSGVVFFFSLHKNNRLKLRMSQVALCIVHFWSPALH